MGVEQLGRYTVLKHLASGGMADVLLARSDGIENFERHVVLKRIRAEHATDKRFITMFLDEARIAATLHHQNVVQVFDVGEDTGGYFFAMEYIHGEDLRRLLSAVSKTKGHMPLGHVIAIVSAVASGLHYAHERRSNDKKALSIVHRDVSPSNILVGYDGSVKVVDFGIAKARTRHVQTSGGTMKGKVSYMSPEQCKGESIDRRSDVFALGIVLYELATTTRLFKGDSDYVIMDAIVTGKVPMPRVRRPDLPNELAQIIMKALAPDPARRYQTADELRLALEQFALAMNLTSSTSGLASYMRKLFGEKPEPWLADDAPTKSGASLVDAGRTSSHNSWTEEVAAVTGETARSSASAITPRETRTSMKLGWEQGRVTGASGGKKLLWFTIPVALALGGIGAWQFVVKPRMDKTDATKPVPAQPAAAQPAPAVAAAAAPTPEPAPVEPAPVAPAETAASAEPTQTKTAAPVRRAGAQRRPADEAAPPEPEPVVEATPMPAPAPPPPPVVTAPAPTPAPAPAEEAPAEPQVTVATLSNATVSAVAADNAASLAKCNVDDLSGNVSVSFQIDGAGKVVKSQLASTAKSPKIAGCILKAVQSWKFPRPPSGAAKGVYTISYQ